MLVNAIRAVFFTSLVILSILGIYFLIPYWLAGGEAGDVPILLSAVAFYFFLGVLWWLTVQKRKGATLLGAALLSVPALAFLGTALRLAFTS